MTHPVTLERNVFFLFFLTLVLLRSVNYQLSLNCSYVQYKHSKTCVNYFECKQSLYTEGTNPFFYILISWLSCKSLFSLKRESDAYFNFFCRWTWLALSSPNTCTVYIPKEVSDLFLILSYSMSFSDLCVFTANNWAFSESQRFYKLLQIQNLYSFPER